MNMSNEFRELEYKYNAEEVQLKDFKNLMESLKELNNFDKLQEASSWDVYYTKTKSFDEFQRFRNGTTPELTRKKKTKDSNNWERVEIDLPLDPERISEKIVCEYVKMDNYEENFRIFKSCFIYWFDSVNYVYYTVYDENMIEKGRFIEVEINKNKVSELGEDPLSELKKHEQQLSELGITSKNRLKKSLFEIYAK